MTRSYHYATPQGFHLVIETPEAMCRLSHPITRPLYEALLGMGEEDLRAFAQRMTATLEHALDEWRTLTEIEGLSAETSAVPLPLSPDDGSLPHDAGGVEGR